jgi:hypothetical protein
LGWFFDTSASALQTMNNSSIWEANLKFSKARVRLCVLEYQEAIFQMEFGIQKSLIAGTAVARLSKHGMTTSMKQGPEIQTSLSK